MGFVWILLVAGGACQATEQAVGNTAVFRQIVVHDTRRAAPFLMPADGTLGSISIYHQGGMGEMLLGAYLGATTPDTRVAVTAPTPLNRAEGWQTVPLTTPVYVPGGTRIWLSWVFQNNPGVRCEVLSPGWTHSDRGWKAGMPDSFGDSEQYNYTYSIYAGYDGKTPLVINEVLFRNDTLTSSLLLDEDRTKQGWIELYNAGNLPIDLAGYCLSDRRDALLQWAFPAVTLLPKEFLRVWGSGKNRRDPASELHASFNTMTSAGVFLTCPGEGTPVDAVESLCIPADHSYGRSPDGAGTWYFYKQPTPGSANPVQNRQSFVIDQRHVSLTAGDEYQLTVTPRAQEVLWTSDNPSVSVSGAGRIHAVHDALGAEARAVITAQSPEANGHSDSCQVTIVDWVANRSALEVVETPSADHILAAEGEALYFTKGQGLYLTTDGFRTSWWICVLPEVPNDPIMLVTPFGYFLQTGATIYQSGDLIQWTATFHMDLTVLPHGLDYYWDEPAQAGYVYAGEYSTEMSKSHRVYRGTFPSGGPPRWETVLEFTPMAGWLDDRSILTAARHVHIVAVDPYTGHLWVGTGDADHLTQILYSDDHGASFRLVGMGSQQWRTTSIWFTARYVYWSMDTGAPQSILRIPRAKFKTGGFWPCATPELDSGTTKVGVRYFITRNETPQHFPTTKGDIYTETRARPLDGENRVRALNDTAYDYKEIVARLDNGSHWDHLWVAARDGDPLLLLCSMAEGAVRDFRCRVFGIKERADGVCDVQELLSVPSTKPTTYQPYVRLDPKAQDAGGYIYFLGRWTDHRIYKTQLKWADSR